MIIKDQEEFFVGTCDSCHKKNVQVRRFEVLIRVKEGQGFWNLCSKCFNPLSELDPKGEDEEVN